MDPLFRSAPCRGAQRATRVESESQASREAMVLLVDNGRLVERFYFREGDEHRKKPGAPTRVTKRASLT